MPNKHLRHAILTEESNGKKVYVDSTVFGSWTELLEHLDATAIASEWKSASSSQDPPSIWTRHTDYGQARELAEHGWPEGVQLLSDMADEAKPYALRPQQRPQWEHTYAGFLPSMPAYVAGSPEHMMIRTQVDDPTRPVVRIVCSITAVAKTSAAAMVRRGAAVLSLVDYLEASGTRVELTLFDGGFESPGYNPGARFETLTILKRADEHCDIDRLAFALVHPAMLRRLGFKLREACPELRYNSRFEGYGTISQYKAEPDEVYLPSMLGDEGYETNEAALKTVIQYATTALGEGTFKQDA